MKCEKCNTELRDGAKFCPECGSAVEPSKQAAPAAQAKPVFCTECGAKNAPLAKILLRVRRGARRGSHAAQAGGIHI